MKKAIIIMAAAALALIGCNKEEKISKESFKLDKTEITVKGEAGTTDIVCTSQNVTPAATSDADWLTCTITKRVLTLEYTKNETGAERTGHINVTAGSLEPVVVTVKQSPFVAPSENDVKVGDLTKDGKGVVYWVDDTNRQIAKAISIERTTGKAWYTAATEVGGLSLVNGAENAKIMKTVEFPAAQWCGELGEGWYLPARDEMLEVFDCYNGIEHDLCTVAQPGSITPEETAARAAFDALLTANGGEAMNTAADNNNGNSYWTSSEFAANQAYYVRFGKFNLAHDVNNSSETRYVRCIKMIGDYVYPAEPVLISLSKATLNFEGAAANETVTVTVKNGTIGAVAVPDEAASWCTASASGNNVTVSVSRNDSGASRSCIVSIEGKSSAGLESKYAELTVNQAQFVADGFKLKEVVSEGGKAVGIVFWVSEDGMSAKIVALKRSEKCAWATADCASGADKTLVGCDDPDNGAVNQAKLLQFVGTNTADLPWLTYMQGLGTGWYMPAHNELKELFAVYNGTTFGGATNAVYDAITADEKAARDAFNKALTDLGGDPLDDLSQSNGDQYISSDESLEGDKEPKGSQEVYSVRFGKAALNRNTAKNGTSRYVRGVKLVTK